jgi:hypothetical protein
VSAYSSGGSISNPQSRFARQLLSKGAFFHCLFCRFLRFCSSATGGVQIENLPVFIKQKSDKLILSLREGSKLLMTRDRFKEMKMTALENLRSDVELYRKDQALQGFVRDELEQKYQTILQMQAEWERGGFWTEENEKRYKEMNKGLH